MNNILKDAKINLDASKEATTRIKHIKKDWVILYSTRLNPK
ncbi:hypothetical protein [Spiroplasma sp. ChiS]|nr:hypothetical protein [Spiroplasma sp. ChiS]